MFELNQEKIEKLKGKIEFKNVFLQTATRGKTIPKTSVFGLVLALDKP